jgi:hypothetical protein
MLKDCVNQNFNQPWMPMHVIGMGAHVDAVDTDTDTNTDTDTSTDTDTVSYRDTAKQRQTHRHRHRHRHRHKHNHRHKHRHTHVNDWGIRVVTYIGTPSEPMSLNMGTQICAHANATFTHAIKTNDMGPKSLTCVPMPWRTMELAWVPMSMTPAPGFQPNSLTKPSHQKANQPIISRPQIIARW